MNMKKRGILFELENAIKFLKLLKGKPRLMNV